MLVLETFILKMYLSFSLVPISRSLHSRGISATYLPVQPYGQDVAGVAVITDLCAFLEMIDVHLAWLRVTDHHHQAAGEEALHDVDIWDFIWEGRQPEVTRMSASPEPSTAYASSHHSLRLAHWMLSNN